MLRLADLLSDIALSLGYYYTSSSSTDIDSDTTNKPRQKHWKRLINDAHISLLYMMPKGFAVKERIIRVPAAYTTGTATLTQGDATLTGVGTTFTRNMQMRQIVVSGDYRPYFLKTFASTTSFELAEAYAHGSEAGASYTIASWAIPLPYDFIAPFGRDAIYDVDYARALPLYGKDVFRKAYPITYNTGVPTMCCIDGMSQFAQITDVGDTVLANATVTFDNYTPLEEDVGKTLRVAADSIPYLITSKSGAATVTVTPVMQSASGTAIALDIEPGPLPLLWFDQAPSSEWRCLLRYYAKPQYLWTDDQRIELGGDWEIAFQALAAYKIISLYSSDKMRKEEALANLKMALEVLPDRVDTAPLIKEVNDDAAGFNQWPRRTFPVVGGLAT